MFKTMAMVTAAAAAAAIALCSLSGCTTATAANPPTAARVYSACAPHPSTYDCQAERYQNVD